MLSPVFLETKPSRVGWSLILEWGSNPFFLLSDKET